MIDPFTLATGIGGLIHLTYEVVQITHHYFQGVRNAAEDIRELLAELATLNDVLPRLHQFLQVDKTTQSGFSQESVLVLAYQACKERLQMIESKLSKKSNNRKIIKSLAWPFVGKEHREIISSIHRWVQIFQFALTIDGRWVVQHR